MAIAGSWGQAGVRAMIEAGCIGTTTPRPWGSVLWIRATLEGVAAPDDLRPGADEASPGGLELSLLSYATSPNCPAIDYRPFDGTRKSKRPDCGHVTGPVIPSGRGRQSSPQVSGSAIDANCPRPECLVQTSGVACRAWASAWPILHGIDPRISGSPAFKLAAQMVEWVGADRGFLRECPEPDSSFGERLTVRRTTPPARAVFASDVPILSSEKGR